MGGPENLPGLLALAFGLGLVHALDADHIMAVSTLSSQPRGTSPKPWWYAGRWALGHGGSLLFLGVIALGVGMTIPENLSRVAEVAVGLVLVLMGIAVLYRLRSRRLHLGFHRHPGFPSHAHWQRRTANTDAARHYHGATLVGVLHGLAGSAPLLALIPAATSGSPVTGLLYLLLFSVGVLLSMLLCGGVLGLVFSSLRSAGERAVYSLRCGIAGGAIAAGGYLIHSVL